MGDPFRYAPDYSLRERLLEIDVDEDTDVTSWEANFLESVLYAADRSLSDKPLSDRQREIAIEIIEKYPL